MKTRNGLSLWVYAALAAIVSAGGATAQGAEAQEWKTIYLAESTEYTQLPLRFGVEKGFFDQQHLHVQFVAIRDPVVGVATGNLTLAFGPTGTFLRAAAHGAPIKIISSAFRSKGPYYFIARPEIKSFADLKGKIVGTAMAGTNMETIAKYILRTHGIDPKNDVTLYANGSNQQAYASLLGHQVDATIIHQPFAALGQLQGHAVVLVRAWTDLPKTYHTGALIAADSTIRNDPDVLKRTLRAYFASYAYAKAHYAEYVPWLEKHLPIDPRAIELSIQQDDVIWDDNPMLYPDALEKTQEIDMALGDQPQHYDAGKYVDLRFIPQEFVPQDKH